jgi:hypothetical protein
MDISVFDYAGTNKDMPMCPIINGYIGFVNIGANIDKSKYRTDIDKIDMSIKN